MPLLKKKDRIRSAKAITSFLDSITDIDSFDVVVSPIDREAFIARGISVRFMPDSYFASINAYNIIFEWPELIQSEYCFLPKTIKSNFDLMYFYKTPTLRFHDPWHEPLWITVLPHSEGPQHEKDIAEFL